MWEVLWSVLYGELRLVALTKAKIYVIYVYMELMLSD